MDLPYLYSASQLQLYIDCPRKWAFRYLEKLVTPQHPSAALGQEVHEQQLGPYLLEGRTFDYTRESGYIAAQMVALLPAPQTPDMKVERSFVIPSPTGKFGYRGFIDLYLPDSVVLPGMTGGAPAVVDFKTTSNIKYAHTEETLATNVQAQLYAMAVAFEDNADVVDLVWTYSKTRKPYRAQRTHLRVLAPHVAEQFASIDRVAASVETIRLSAPRALDVPPNLRMCDAYGGCPYRHKCDHAPPVVAGGVNQMAFEQKTSSLLARMKKVAAPEVPAAAYDAAERAAIQAEAPKDPTANYYEPMAVALTAATGIPAEALPDWATAPVDPGIRPAINPPESLLPPAPAVGIEAPKRGRPKAAAKTVEVTTQVPIIAPVVVPTVQEIAKAVVDELVARLRGAVI